MRECGATFKNKHAKHDHYRRGNGPTAYVVEASAFSALSLSHAIVANITGGVSITSTSLCAGADPEADVVKAATIVDVV
eukprot:jgi/Tetstr1/430216/TSEL_020045.t1